MLTPRISGLSHESRARQHHHQPLLLVRAKQKCMFPAVACTQRKGLGYSDCSCQTHQSDKVLSIPWSQMRETTKTGQERPTNRASFTQKRTSEVHFVATIH
jgi:hypothetical protein